jgi:hypothetical protein
MILLSSALPRRGERDYRGMDRDFRGLWLGISGVRELGVSSEAL